MGLLDNYKSIARSSGGKEDKESTILKLDAIREASPDLFYQIVRKLIQFKLHRKGGTEIDQNSALDILNDYLLRAQQEGIATPSADELYFLVKNRSSVWKADLPATFKNYLSSLPAFVLLYLVGDEENVRTFLNKAGVHIKTDGAAAATDAFSTSETWLRNHARGLARNLYEENRSLELSQDWVVDLVNDSLSWPVTDAVRTRLAPILQQFLSNQRLRANPRLNVERDRLAPPAARHDAGCKFGFPLTQDQAAYAFMGCHRSMMHAEAVITAFNANHFLMKDGLPSSSCRIDFGQPILKELDVREFFKRVVQFPMRSYGISYGVFEIEDQYDIEVTNPNAGVIRIKHNTSLMRCRRLNSKKEPIGTASGF